MTSKERARAIREDDDWKWCSCADCEASNDRVVARHIEEHAAELQMENARLWAELEHMRPIVEAACATRDERDHNVAHPLIVAVDMYRAEKARRVLLSKDES